MEELLSRLVRLLDEKCGTLDRLVGMQKDVQSFLTQPRVGGDFEDVAKPQKALMAELRHYQERQRLILADMAERVGVSSIPSLQLLLQFLDASWKSRIGDYIERIRKSTVALKKANSIHHRLNQANQRFMQRWADFIRPSNKYVGTYNAYGRPEKWASGGQISRMA